MTPEELIEQMADALGGCSEMLNGYDQMQNMMRGDMMSTKSALTAEVDAAMDAWRKWNFA